MSRSKERHRGIGEVRLRGYVFDESGLKEVVVNGRQILKAPTREAPS